jgi:hypothetical protein
MSAAEKIVSPKPRARSRKANRIPRSKYKLADLKEPFDPDEVSWKVISQGIKNDEPWALVVPYLEARPLMNRLDNVVGPENWKDDYEPIGTGFFGALSIFFNGDWITKKDGADETEISAFKGGLSDAFKRVCVKWGMGRYLYEVEPAFADFSQVYSNTKGALPVDIEVTPATEDKPAVTKRFYWVPPSLPKFAMPMKAVEIQKARKEKEAKENRAKLEAQPKSAKKIQDEISSLCIRRGISPAVLNSFVALAFEVNNPEHLNIEQLEELQEQIEEGKVLR